MTNLTKPTYLTGFGPFSGVEQNPTEQLVQRLQNQSFPGLSLTTDILPVSYKGSFRHAQTALREQSFKTILHLGVSAKDNTLRLERQAINSMSASIPDNDGIINLNLSIDEVMPSSHVLQTGVELEELVQSLREQGTEVKISKDAGQYVCNALYYQSLQWAQKQTETPQVLFVHVPQVGNVSEEGSLWTLESLEESIQSLLEWFGKA
jgi:pyroglutamyl-peptidase